MTSTLHRVLPRFYLPLVILIAAALAWKPLFGGVDFWAHAAIGRWIWRHGGVPHETLFLWGQAPQPWIYHSWLSQLVFYGTMAGGENGGPYLALGLTVIIVLASFLPIWWMWRKRAGINCLTPLLFAFALWIASARFNPRPELFSALFLTILLVSLARRESDGEESFAAAWRRERWRVFGLAALFALWANFHGGVALGLLMLGATALCDGLQDRGAARNSVLGVLLLLAVLAVNLNPYGISYWQALKPVGGAMFALIDEWKPLWREPSLPPLALVFLGVLGLLALTAWMQNPQRRWSHLAWLLIGAAFMLKARRNLWTFSQVCLIVMAANAMAFDTGALWRKWRRPDAVPVGMQTLARAGVVLCLTLWLIGLLPASPRATDEKLPVRATQFVRDHHLRGRFFVDYLNTSYWQWRFGGQPPVYIDLLNAYDDHLLADYFEILRAQSSGQKKLAELHPDYIFFGAFDKDSRLAPLAKFLDASPQWHCLYRQQDGTLWENLTTPEHSHAGA
jgi:hypothetical protein